MPKSLRGRRRWVTSSPLNTWREIKLRLLKVVSCMSMGNSSQDNIISPLLSAKNSSSSSLPPLPLVFLSLSSSAFSAPSSHLSSSTLPPSPLPHISHLPLSSLPERGFLDFTSPFSFAACVCATGQLSSHPFGFGQDVCQVSTVKLNLCLSAVSSIRPGGRTDTGRTRSTMKRRWKRC